jgi:hypothetical protein
MYSSMISEVYGNQGSGTANNFREFFHHNKLHFLDSMDTSPKLI